MACSCLFKLNQDNHTKQLKGSLRLGIDAGASVANKNKSGHIWMWPYALANWHARLEMKPFILNVGRYQLLFDCQDSEQRKGHHSASSRTMDTIAINKTAFH